MNFTNLRGILTYVPEFREKIFVIAIDGAVVAHENFANLALDLAVLRSLNVRVIVVHGIGLQVRELAQERSIPLSSSDGTGPTDTATLKVCQAASCQVAQQILATFSSADLRAALPNALVVHPFGIVGGVNHLLTGRIERVDTAFLHDLLDRGILPVISPIGSDREGNLFRVNSDAVAVAVAEAVGAVKLIYLSAEIDYAKEADLARQLSVSEAEAFLQRHAATSSALLLSKLSHSIAACRGGVPRIHLLDIRIDDALLSELFSQVGVGTMVYSEGYESIRKAQKKDVRSILQLIAQSVDAAELLPRTRQSILARLNDYYVLEIDRAVVGCVALHRFPESSQAEVACLSVARVYENQGLGRKLVQFAQSVAREEGIRQLFALSARTYNFFTQKAGFREGTPDDLPAARRLLYEQSGRRSKVLLKQLF
ncbi:Amino-acid N-acetyltransferase [Methylacidimicrobium sp. AP8]|uniref:amino-acid N-acetyltransferase n=1 Tax=Methylacidimicrobium sp. AP8 TaxID=2730359 RepID=UPI0018BFE513|nr:amino-acid N-acetyltransferase [Methylacidimicrobium sp. AP8]CAB4244601.1 Amino-acid N-acetyltransferase [Methylacidimicrobium sp. AP8]